VFSFKMALLQFRCRFLFWLILYANTYTYQGRVRDKLFGKNTGTLQCEDVATFPATSTDSFRSECLFPTLPYIGFNLFLNKTCSLCSLNNLKGVSNQKDGSYFYLPLKDTSRNETISIPNGLKKGHVILIYGAPNAAFSVNFYSKACGGRQSCFPKFQINCMSFAPQYYIVQFKWYNSASQLVTITKYSAYDENISFLIRVTEWSYDVAVNGDWKFTGVNGSASSSDRIRRIQNDGFKSILTYIPFL